MWIVQTQLVPSATEKKQPAYDFIDCALVEFINKKIFENIFQFS